MRVRAFFLDEWIKFNLMRMFKDQRETLSKHLCVLLFVGHQSLLNFSLALNIIGPELLMNTALKLWGTLEEAFTVNKEQQPKQSLFIWLSQIDSPAALIWDPDKLKKIKLYPDLLRCGKENTALVCTLCSWVCSYSEIYIRIHTVLYVAQWVRAAHHYWLSHTAGCLAAHRTLHTHTHTHTLSAVSLHRAAAPSLAAVWRESAAVREGREVQLRDCSTINSHNIFQIVLIERALSDPIFYFGLWEDQTKTDFLSPICFATHSIVGPSLK